MKRRKWKAEEDDILRSYVGDKISWVRVADSIPGRTGKQCRDRYKRAIQPDIRLEPFTRAEQCFVLAMQEIVGNKWVQIAKAMDRRSECQVKNTWYGISKKRGRLKDMELVMLLVSLRHVPQM